MVLVGWQLAAVAITLGVDGGPALRDLACRPGLGAVGAVADDQMEVVAQDGVGEDIDGEDARHTLQVPLQTLFAMVVLIAAEEGAAHASAQEVVTPGAAMVDEGAAREGHGRDYMNPSAGSSSTAMG